MLGHVTFDAIQRLLHRLRAMQKQRERELERLQSAFEADAEEERQSIQSNAKEDDEEQQQEDPPSHYRHQHHKPKKDTFYTKQQMRQKQKLKHMEKERLPSGDGDELAQSPPKLHHRAWSALPQGEKGNWRHSLESRQALNEDHLLS